MTTAPTISVIITTYNYADFIVDAIESVLAQTHPADEVLVVDDGSTDATSQRVAPYVDRGAVRYIVQENRGPSEARNHGIRLSSGDLIAFLDADDTWMPDKLRLQLDWLMAHPSASMVSGQMVWWSVPRDERRVVTFEPLSQAAMRRELCVRNVVGNPSMALVRRGAIEAVGPYDTTLRWGQDWEIFIRLARAGEIGFVPEPVIVYRWHRGSLSHEGRLEQLAMNHAISRKTIATFEPAWQRPLLRARAWSAIELDRARIMGSFKAPRVRLVRHAALALVSWPFEDSTSKATTLGCALIGEATYRRAVAGVRRRLRHTRSITSSTPGPTA